MNPNRDLDRALTGHSGRGPLIHVTSPKHFNCALGVLMLLQASQAPQGDRTGVTLPAGPAARAFAGVGAGTAAMDLPTEQASAVDFAAWDRPEAWQAWADAVRAETGTSQPDAQRRASLARAALSQGRWDDAWDHFAATGGSPGICAALLPQFLPGVQTAQPSAAGVALPEGRFAMGLGGQVRALPDGVLLRPAIPPPSVPAAQVPLGRTWIDRREMRLEELHVGTATVSMRVALESDGIQIEFVHRAGGSARVRVLLPELADFEVRVAYIDWMRQDDVGEVLEVAIAPGDDAHTLFGRFKPRSVAWPTNLPQNSPRAIADMGLRFEFPEQMPDASVFRAAGPAFARVLGVEVNCGNRAGPEFSGVRIDLSDPAVARRKFLGMVTLAERFALRPR